MTRIVSNIFASFFCLTIGGQAFGAGAGADIVNYWAILLHKLGMHDHDAIHQWMVVPAGLLTLCIIALLGFFYKKSVQAKGDDLRPAGRFGLSTFVEGLLDFVFNLGEDIIGKGKSERFFPLLTSLFIFIFISNVSGLVPGFPPATESLNTNLAMGLAVFLAYNIAGIKEHKGSYIKQFLGPFWWLAPLFLFIELVSHLVRPISLSLRLYGNIFGDHLVMSVFTGLTYVILPAGLLFFGLLVASIQSFVFTLLSGIYISMAISHDH